MDILTSRFMESIPLYLNQINKNLKDISESLAKLVEEKDDSEKTAELNDEGRS